MKYDDMEIYARNVSNLTDARFFAALGAKWLEFSYVGLNMNPTEFNAMKEWITGSNWVLALNEIESNKENEFINETQIKNFSGSLLKVQKKALNFIHCKAVELLSSTNDMLGFDAGLIVDEIFNLSDNDIQKLRKIGDSQKLYLLLGMESGEELVQLIESIDPTGIVFQGGEEEKTGFKSFDEIDDLIEMLIQAELIC